MHSAQAPRPVPLTLLLSRIPAPQCKFICQMLLFFNIAAGKKQPRDVILDGNHRLISCILMYMTTFRSVPGFPAYQVSDTGVVARVATQSGKPIFRVLKQFSNNGRDRTYVHPYVRPCQNGVAKKKHVHQLVAETFLGARPAGTEVNHKDCNPLNNSVENLEYVTPDENRRHYVESGECERRNSRYRTSDRYRAVQAAQRANGWSTPKSKWSK